MKKAIMIGLSVLALGSAVPAMAEPYGYFDRLGDRIERRLDHRGDRIDRRLDRVGHHLFDVSVNSL